MVKHIGISTPFYKAQKYAKMNPADCLVISNELWNELNVYGDAAEVIFHINFSQFNVCEDRTITVGQIKRLLRIGKAITRENDYMGTRSININRNDCQVI